MLIQGKEKIKTNHDKINELLSESDDYVSANKNLETNVEELSAEQEKFVGADKKLSKLNNFKGQISNKVSTITKEHKFFTDNTVCPTCTQPIEESFRLNKIADVQTKARELKKVSMTLKNPSRPNKTENVNSKNYQRRLRNSTMTFLKTILTSLSTRDRSENLNQKFKLLPNNLKTEILKMRN